MIRAALALLAGLAAPAAAHQDFPPEWCGGRDCRLARPGEVTVEGDVYRVSLPGGVVRLPLSAAPLWEGCRVALCIHAEGDRLNRCNRARGECPPQSEFGLLIPAWHVFPELGEDCAEAQAETVLSHAGLAGPRAVFPAPPGGGWRAEAGPEAGPAVPAVPLSPSLGYLGALVAAALFFGIRRRA